MPSSSTSTLKLRPADPFDLIRWLARSQSDPRKAVAELVQNSLDANARRVTIERRRVRRAPALVIRDDGEGIVPELSREAALRAIATNIGHSRKRGLSPRERHDEIVAGKYGIGLLGFWSIGHRMDIRSRVGGGEVWVLRMVEDQERAELLRDCMAFETADTFTEVVISELHDSAQRLLTGRRLNDYLASELRGMLLATGAGSRSTTAWRAGSPSGRSPSCRAGSWASGWRCPRARRSRATRPRGSSSISRVATTAPPSR